LREERRRRREKAHAQDGDRPEQARYRVGRLEIELYTRDERPDADELRPQRQRGEKERGEERASPQSTTVS